MQRSCVTPFRDRDRSTQIGHGRLASSLIRCTTGWPHRKYQKEEQPYLKHVLKPVHVMLWLRSVSRAKMENGGFVRLSAVQSKKEIEARHSGTLFNTSIDGVKPGKRLIVSLHLDELPNWKLVNSEVKSVDGLPKRGSLQWVHGTLLESPWKSH